MYVVGMYSPSFPLHVDFHAEPTDAFKSPLKQGCLRSEGSHIYIYIHTHTQTHTHTHTHIQSKIC